MGFQLPYQLYVLLQHHSRQYTRAVASALLVHEMKRKKKKKLLRIMYVLPHQYSKQLLYISLYFYSERNVFFSKVYVTLHVSCKLIVLNLLMRKTRLQYGVQLLLVCCLVSCLMKSTRLTAYIPDAYNLVLRTFIQVIMHASRAARDILFSQNVVNRMKT